VSGRHCEQGAGFSCCAATSCAVAGPRLSRHPRSRFAVLGHRVQYQRSIGANGTTADARAMVRSTEHSRRTVGREPPPDSNRRHHDSTRPVAAVRHVHDVAGRDHANVAARQATSTRDARVSSCMDRGSQRVAAALSRMQERDGLRSRVGGRSQLVHAGTRRRGHHSRVPSADRHRRGRDDAVDRGPLVGGHVADSVSFDDPHDRHRRRDQVAVGVEAHGAGDAVLLARCDELA
jgi:hypothetical protein